MNEEEIMDIDTSTEAVDLSNATSYIDDDLSEAEREALLQDDYIVEEEIERPEQAAPSVKKGKFYSDSYQAPDVPRRRYLQEFYNEIIFNDYKDFGPFAHPLFIHSDLTGSLNFYHTILKRALAIFAQYYTGETLHIINGFRNEISLDTNEHRLGIAVDIAVNDWEHARRVMSAAYITGIPTILPAGDIKKGQGHVHLDMAPRPDYTYDAGQYTGPWS